MKIMRHIRKLALWPLLTTWAHACTVCETANAHQVREGIFNGHFLQTLAMVTLSFPVLVFSVVIVHFCVPDMNALEDRPAMREEIVSGNALHAFRLP